MNRLKRAVLIAGLIAACFVALSVIYRVLDLVFR